MSSSKTIRFALLLLVVIWLATAWWAHHEFLPYDVNNTDIGTWLFQAQTFADGKIWRPTPEPREFFQQWQAIVREHSYAYYPPGHALFLAATLVMGLDPWVIPWLLSGFSLALVYIWSRRLVNPQAAMVAVCVMALAPFFAANAPSLLSHSTTLFLTLLFLCTVVRWQQDGNILFALGSGMLLTAVFATRSANAAALGMVWIPWVVWTRKSNWRKDLRSWGAFVFGILGVFVPLMLYYHALAGRWTLDLFTDYWPRNRFGFGRDLGRGEPGHYFQTYTDHDWSGMLANLRYSFSSLAEWWAGNQWVSFLLLLLLFIRFSVARCEAIPNSQFLILNFLPLAIWPLVHIVLHAFYFTQSTPFSGPRYLVEIMPALALANGWMLIRLHTFPFGKWFSVLLMIGMVSCSVYFKNDFYLKNARGAVARRQVERCVIEGVKTPALVFIRSFWLGHPYPIFLNRPGLSDPILYACDRGAEDRRLVALHAHRNAYILAVTQVSRSAVRTELIPIYETDSRRWLIEPESVAAPFFVGSKFTPSICLGGENARCLFFPKPEEIENQQVESAILKRR